MHDIENTVRLLRAYLKGTIHPDNDMELRTLFEAYPELREMVDKLGESDNLHRELLKYQKLIEIGGLEREKRVLSNIINRIEQPIPKKSRSQKNPIVWYAVAACFIALTLLGIWKLKYTDPLVSDEGEVVRLAENILPGGNRATLHFSDGTTLGLDQRHAGIVIGDSITYNDGSVTSVPVYDKTNMMTLSTPRGGQYQIVLSDGTKVWLNAETRLRYPVQFTGEQRLVELDGEAYFEVAKSHGKPFLVATAKEKIEVLGTHFNVYSYPDEDESKVSLLEGKVKVTIPKGLVKELKPGDQAINNGANLVVQQMPIDESVSWKNDEFMFNNELLGTALAQVARWYDLDIEIDQSLQTITLWGSVSRLDSFDKVLKIIKMTDDKIKVKIEGRRVRLMK